MKKIVLVIGLFFLLVSCQSMRAPESTATPVPTNTIIPPTATSTVEPTSTPVPPTATTESYQDYVQTSDNIFPLEGVENGLVDFTCTADFENLILKDYTTPDGMRNRLWVLCTDGGQQFITEVELNNNEIRYFTVAGAASTGSSNAGLSDAFVLNQAKRLLEAQGITGKTKVKIIGGSNSGVLLKFNDPFASVFPTVNWEEAFLEFAKTGDYTKLPQIPNIAGRLLYGIRIQLK